MRQGPAYRLTWTLVPPPGALILIAPENRACGLRSMVSGVCVLLMHPRRLTPAASTLDRLPDSHQLFDRQIVEFDGDDGRTISEP